MSGGEKKEGGGVGLGHPARFRSQLMAPDVGKKKYLGMFWDLYET